MISTNKNFTGEFYSNKEGFTEQYKKVIELFDQSTEVLRKERNTLKQVDFEGKASVVKAFKVPSFPQNYSYGLIAKSKAKKSYDNAYRLIELGLLTPLPIGYFEHRSGGKLKESYYVCEFAAKTKTLDELLTSETAVPGLMQQFGKFCCHLHSKGVFHRDFNPKNILVSESGGEREFSLVDINRITWYRKLPLDRSMQSLSRLSLSDEQKHSLLSSYATSAELEVSDCLALLKNFELKTQRFFRNKRRLRKIFPKK